MNIDAYTMKKCIFLLLFVDTALLAFSQPALRRFTVADGLPTNQVRQIVQLPNHQILVATEGMFSLYNGRRFEPLSCQLDSVHTLPVFGGHDCLWQGDSLLWLKDFYFLYLFDVRERRFRYDYAPFLRQFSLRSFMQKRESTLLQEHKLRLAPFETRWDSLMRTASIPEDLLTAYLCDHQGGQWFGLREEGVCYLPPQASPVRLLSLDNGDIARRMVPIDARYMLVAGEQGIYVFDCQHQSIARTLVTGDIFAYEMSRDARGRIWVSTRSGLYAYVHGELQHYDWKNTSGMIHDYVRFAHSIDENRLLVCNYMHQLGYFYPDQARMEMLNERLPSLNSYRTMMVATSLSNRNHVAVCTQNGLFVLDVSSDNLLSSRLVAEAGRYSRKFNCILHDRTGRTWIGTQNGLLVLSSDTTLSRFTRSEGLSNNCIQSIAEDAQGYIWVATSSGVNRINAQHIPDDVRIRPLGPDDGFPDVEFTERGICIMPDGTLYLATPMGIAAFPVKAFQQPLQPDSLVLVNLRVAEEEMALDTLPLSLSYKQNYIELQVSPLNYAHPRLTTYRYRLRGLEQEWRRTLGDEGLLTIRYSALAPGRYTLEVQASLGDGLWGPVLCKSFHIAPPMWLTWWAKGFYLLFFAVVVIGTISLYVRYRRRRLERENEERVNRLFQLREAAGRQFAQSVEMLPTGGESTGLEENVLLQRVMAAVSAQMDNADYTMEQLARDVGMSRANLYKKMQTQLGITPNDFVRNARLKHAAHLLAETNIPVNQLSLMVGFQTPRYFSQCFRQMFGVTPSQYRGRKEVD